MKIPGTKLSASETCHAPDSSNSSCWMIVIGISDGAALSVTLSAVTTTGFVMKTVSFYCAVACIESEINRKKKIAVKTKKPDRTCRDFLKGSVVIIRTIVFKSIPFKTLFHNDKWYDRQIFSGGDPCHILSLRKF